MSSHYGPASDVSTTSLGGTSLPGRPTDIAVEDWDDLFSAVKERLRRIASEQRAQTPGPPAPDSVGRIQASVLECVEALEQLHATQRYYS